MATANSSSFEYNPAAGVCYRTLTFMGHPGYRVGDDGSVWTRWHKIGHGNGGGTHCVLGSKWRRMRTPQRGESSYLVVRLAPGRRMKYVHRLILEAFVGPCPPGMECRHFPDRNPANNTLSNLRWDTHSANLADKITHGTTNRGERQGHAKLTADIVRAIRSEHAAGGVTQISLARKYGVCRPTVTYVLSGRNWKHVTPHGDALSPAQPA